MNDPYRLARNAGTALATAALFAVVIPAGAAQAPAQAYVQPYYDATRDVMVTPVSTSSSPVLSSPGAVHPIRSTRASASRLNHAQPASNARHGLYPSPVQSSPGAVIPRSAASRVARSNTYVRPYYDARRDVVVTPAYPAVHQKRVANPRVGTPTAAAKLVVRRDQLAQGPSRIAVAHGSRVTLAVETDLADSLRVDGYNLAAPIMPGQPLLLTFLAERPGRFAYRLGRTGREIGVLEVGAPRATTVSMR